MEIKVNYLVITRICNGACTFVTGYFFNNDLKVLSICLLFLGTRPNLRERLMS